MSFNTIEEAQKVYSELYKKNPTKQIDVSFDRATGVYHVKQTNRKFKAHPQVPIGLDLQVIYGDTDSIMVKFKYNRQDEKQNRIDTFRLAEICGNNLTNEVFKRPPIEMEFEKIFCPYILLTKKRYIGKIYSDKRQPFKLKATDYKGIAITRRDYCQYVKKCYNDIIESVTSESLEKSIDIFKNYIIQLDTFNVPIEDYILSSTLAKAYKTSPPHVILSKILIARGKQVQIGDRIPYIFIEKNDALTNKRSEFVEDPEYTREHNLKPNRMCYLEQLAKPILGFYKIILANDPDLLTNLIEWVNVYCKNYGGKVFKEKDFVLFEEN